MRDSNKPEPTAQQIAELYRRMHRDHNHPRTEERAREQQIRTGHAVNMQRMSKGLQRG